VHLLVKRILNVTKMHGTTIKITDVQQAKLCNNYKNTKLKLLQTNEAIRFNKICRMVARHSALNTHTTAETHVATTLQHL
jgi:hypothetical protein